MALPQTLDRLDDRRYNRNEHHQPTNQPTGPNSRTHEAQTRRVRPAPPTTDWSVPPNNQVDWTQVAGAGLSLLVVVVTFGAIRNAERGLAAERGSVTGAPRHLRATSEGQQRSSGVTLDHRQPQVKARAGARL
jgi:hypothetical protein